jgi:hypothetical protein
MHYSQLLPQLLRGALGGKADFSRLSKVIEEYASRSAMAGGSAGEEAVPWLHLSGLGSFRNLSDSEKQVLILKGILLMGGRKGAVLLDEEDWFSLSPSFRARAESIARSVSEGSLALENRVYHWVPHLWSNTGRLGEELGSQLPGEVRTIACMDLLFRDPRAEVLFVDPQQVMLREPVSQLLDWARAGKTLVLPRHVLFTEAARAELKDSLENSPCLKIQGGAPLEVQTLGAGRVLFYDPVALDAASSRADGVQQDPGWGRLVQGVLSLVQIQPLCRVGDPRLRAVSMMRPDGTLGVFVFNLSNRPVLGDLHFGSEVAVSDLASQLVASQSILPQARARDRQGLEKESFASRFQLEVPPCGVLPIAVEGVGESAEDRSLAALSSGLLRQGAMEAAHSELAGFDEMEQQGGPLWN